MTSKFTSHTIRHYINALASDAPVPGGGSVAGLSAACACGLIQMVARISVKRAKTEQARATLQQAIAQLERLRRDATKVIDADPVAYNRVMQAYARARKHPGHATQRAIERALARAYESQRQLAQLTCQIKTSLAQVTQVVSGAIANDLLVARSLLQAAFDGAIATARVNVKYFTSTAQREQCEHTLQMLTTQFHTHHD